MPNILIRYINNFVGDGIYLSDIYKHTLFIASVHFPLLSNTGLYEEQDKII